MWHLQKRSDHLDFIGRARAPQAAGTPGGYGHSCPCAKSSGRQCVLSPRCSPFLLLAVSTGFPTLTQGPRFMDCLGGKATGTGRTAGYSHDSAGRRRPSKSPSSLKRFRSSFPYSASSTHLHPAVIILADHPWASAALSLSIQCPHIRFIFVLSFCVDRRLSPYCLCANASCLFLQATGTKVSPSRPAQHG